MVGGLLGKVLFVFRLEDDFGNELDVALFAGADGRGAVEVADGVGHLSKAAASCADSRYRVTGANATNGAYSGCQIDAVEEVKEVRAKLNLNPFRYWDVLDERQIYVAESRPSKLVAGQIRCARACRSAR